MQSHIIPGKLRMVWAERSGWCSPFELYEDACPQWEIQMFSSRGAVGHGKAFTDTVSFQVIHSQWCSALPLQLITNPSNHKVLLGAGFSRVSFCVFFFHPFFLFVSNSVANVICKSPCAVSVSLSMNLEQSAELWIVDKAPKSATDDKAATRTTPSSSSLPQ